MVLSTEWSAQPRPRRRAAASARATRYRCRPAIPVSFVRPRRPRKAQARRDWRCQCSYRCFSPPALGGPVIAAIRSRWPPGRWGAPTGRSEQLLPHRPGAKTPGERRERHRFQVTGSRCTHPHEEGASPGESRSPPGERSRPAGFCWCSTPRRGVQAEGEAQLGDHRPGQARHISCGTPSGPRDPGDGAPQAQDRPRARWGRRTRESFHPGRGNPGRVSAASALPAATATRLR